MEELLRSRATIALVLGCVLVVTGTARSRLDASETARPVAAPARIHTSARLQAEGPPPGHTGGFGEPTCRACHREFELNPEGSLELEGLPPEYEPGRTYVVTLVLKSFEMGRAGFQAAFRFDAGEDTGGNAGVAEPVDERVEVRTDSVTTVRYVQHRSEGTAVQDPEVASWSFRWTAPDSDLPVAFHAAANSANGDDSPFGDLIYATEARARSAAGGGR